VVLRANYLKVAHYPAGKALGKSTAALVQYPHAPAPISIFDRVNAGNECWSRTMLPIINCPKCQKPLERGYLRAEWAIAHDQRFAAMLREVDEAEKQGKTGGDYYGGRSFHLVHRNHPTKGEKRLHCLIGLDCLVVVSCTRDDAAADFPPHAEHEETSTAQ